MEELLALFNRFTEMVVKAFGSDHRFMTSRDKAYKQVVNDTSVFRLDLPSNKARCCLKRKIIILIAPIIFQGNFYP